MKQATAAETRYQARIAGLLYGLGSSMAPFAFLYVPGQLLVANDALATAERVRAGEGLLRAAIWCELYGVLMVLFAALALYHLFERVDRRTSAIMAAMMLVSVPISYVNVLFHVAPTMLLKSPAFASVLDPNQIAALVTLSMRLHNSGLVVNQIFWGLWLFPIGLLVMRSGFIPRWLAWPLFFAGGGYVLNSLGTLLLPASWRWLTASLQILGIGEVPLFGFYLMTWGARGAPADRVSASLVVSLFVVGMAALVLLNTHRIDGVQYFAIKAACLVVVAVLVLRWRAERSRAIAAGAAEGKA